MSKIFIANLKANLNFKDIGDYIYQLNHNLLGNKRVIVCPTFIHIPFFVSEKFSLGSQDVSICDNGPFTGEVTAKQLSDSNVRYSIVGHSERRENFKEDDTTINKKIKKLLENNIVPILCIGENKEEKIMMKTNIILRRKLLADFADLRKSEIDQIIIAYEPIWAIGTGITPTYNEIEETSSYIKDIIKSAFKVDIKVLYGGSVSLKNLTHFKDMQITDGFLIGTACINPLEFTKIVQEID